MFFTTIIVIAMPSRDSTSPRGSYYSSPEFAVVLVLVDHGGRARLENKYGHIPNQFRITLLQKSDLFYFEITGSIFII